MGRDRSENVATPRLLHVTTIPMSLTFLRGQVDFMQARGFDIAALSSPGPGLDAFGRDFDVRTYAVEMPRRITPFSDLRAVWQLARAIRQERPVIVHAHTPKGGLLGMIAATLTRVPVRIYHMRGLPMMGATGLRRKLLFWTERLACMLAHRVICVSNSLRDIAVREKICPEARAVVLAGGSGQGVDARRRFNPDFLDASARTATRSRFGIPPEAVVIGFVGRLVCDKGIVELARAWQAMRDRFPDTHMLLVGPIEPQDPVPSEILAQLQRDERVHMVGEDFNTPPLYAAMDVVVLPTYREGFPNVPLEAAAMRLPIVSTNIPGCVDAIQDGHTGLLVPPRDARALQKAIQCYLDDAVLRRRHGEAARDHVVRNFGEQAIRMALFQQYRHLLRLRSIDVRRPQRLPSAPVSHRRRMRLRTPARASRVPV
jgi:glycosyltransferase involved in cell wall biosynthesis